MIELIDTNPISGLQTLIEFDETDPRKFHVHHRQDVEAVLAANRELQKHPDYKKAGIKRGLQHVARIPEVWVHHMLKTHGVDVMSRDHWPKVRQLLMRPEYRHLRVTTGDI